MHSPHVVRIPARRNTSELHGHPCAGTVGRALLAAAIILLSLLPLTVLADPDVPDALEVRSVIACHDLLEEDDMAVAVHYNIDYSVTGEPSDSAQDLFLVRLLDGATQLGVVRPYPYFNDGYSQGIVLLYWDAADAPTWEDEYTVRIQGTPAAWGTPPETNFTLGASSYSGVDGDTANQQALYDWMVDALEDLETNWTTSLLDHYEEGAVLNETGQSYMTGAVPGLQGLCPDLFWIRSSAIDTTPRTWGTGQADAYEARYAGTWVGDAMDGAADLFGVPAQLIGSILFVLLPFVLIMVLCERSFFTSTPALIALPLLMAMGALMGFFSMAFFAICVICFVLLIGYVLFFRTS